MGHYKALIGLRPGFDLLKADAAGFLEILGKADKLRQEFEEKEESEKKERFWV